VKRPGGPIFFPIAVVLGLVALILNAAGYYQSSSGSVHEAHQIEQALRAHVHYIPDAETTRMILAGEILSIVGLALTLAGFIFMSIAVVRHEKGWYLTLFLLLMFSVMPLLLA
jgi:hypothetical protein